MAERSDTPNTKDARMPAGRLTRRLRAVPVYLVGLLVLLIFALPYIWMFASSFKTTLDIFDDMNPFSIWTLVPREPTMDNFVRLWTDKGIGRYLLNTLVIAAAQIVLTLVVCTTAAFALSKFTFRGRGVLFVLILVSFMIPFQTILIPLFDVIRRLGLTDTYQSVFLPFAASAFAVFILRQAFQEIPVDMIDAARIDGASDLQLFRLVCLPMVKPALATVVLLTFIDAWNSFLWPLIVLNDPSKQVIQIAIANTARPGLTPDFGLIFAGATIATLPALLVFLALQRYFVQGIALTGLKG